MDGESCDYSLGYDDPFDSLVSLDKYPWYHGRISRAKATILLGRGPNGSFLVRESETYTNEFSLSVHNNGHVVHYRLLKTSENEVYIPNGLEKFSTLAEFVAHYSIYPSNICTTLKYPVPKTENDLRDWEVHPGEFSLKQQLHAGRYGELYEGLWKKYNNRKVAVKQ